MAPRGVRNRTDARRQSFQRAKMRCRSSGSSWGEGIPGEPIPPPRGVGWGGGVGRVRRGTAVRLSTQDRLIATRSGASDFGVGQGMRTSRMPSR